MGDVVHTPVCFFHELMIYCQCLILFKQTRPHWYPRLCPGPKWLRDQRHPKTQEPSHCPLLELSFSLLAPMIALLPLDLACSHVPFSLRSAGFPWGHQETTHPPDFQGRLLHHSLILSSKRTLQYQGLAPAHLMPLLLGCPVFSGLPGPPLPSLLTEKTPGGASDRSFIPLRTQRAMLLPAWPCNSHNSLPSRQE